MESLFKKSEHIFESFEKRLTSTNKKELTYNLLKHLLKTLIFFFALGFLVIILEAVFRFGSDVRTVFFWGYISTFITTLLYNLAVFVFRRTRVLHFPELIRYSQIVGNKFEPIKDSLANSLSLYNRLKLNHESNSYLSKELVGANLDYVDNRTRKINLSSFISFKNLKRLLLVLIISTLFYTLSFFIFPSTLLSSVNRIINYEYSFIDNELGIIFNISPGDVETIKGCNVDIAIKINSNKPDLRIDEIKFFTKEVTHDGVEILLSETDLVSDGDNHFSTSIENINNNIIYYAAYKEVKSSEYKISIADYPVLKSFTVSIYPPGFTDMPSKTLDENQGDIFCIGGSRIYFDLESNKSLSSAGIVFDEDFVAFDVNEERATGSIIVTKSGKYNFVLKDIDGSENKDANVYSIKVISDEPPKISIIEPEEINYTLTGENDVIVRARITDDFGFSKLVLAYRKVDSKSTASPKFNFINVPIKNLNATSLEVPYVWNVTNIGLRSGQSAEYYMEVTDNTGKSTKSDIRTIQYKSLSDILKESEKFSKDLKADLKSILDDASDLQKDIEELKKNNRYSEELAINEQKKRELQEKVENLQNSLNSAQDKMNQVFDELQKKNILSEETLEQYMKLQEMFNKINTPELQEMLKKLREALEKNNLDQLREELKNFRFDEEAFKKQMEQLMELMKKIENLQKFGELTQKLDDITKQQEDLKKDTEATNKDSKEKLGDLSKEQKNIKEQTKDFKEELKKLIEELRKMKEDFNPEDLEDIRKEFNQRDIENKMQQSSDELQKGDKQDSESTQEDILSDLKEMNEKMMDALEKAMNMQSMQNKLMNKLKQIKQEIDKLSEDQGDLKDRTEDLKKNDKNEFTKKQKEQEDLQQRLSETINELMNLSKSGVQITPELGKELGNAYNKMNNAGDNLSESNKENAVGNQGKAKESLDNASKMLGDMLSQMGSKSCNTGQPGEGRMGQLMQQLAQLIAKQKGLSSLMNQMGEFGQKGNNGKEGDVGNLSEEQKMRMDKLRLEQEQIRKSLAELNEEFEKEKQRTGQRLLGDLNEVQKEMQEIIKDLSEYNVDKETLEKQNRILSRMLDAQLSQREKDFEQKRESRPGENMVRISPPEIVLSGPKSFNALKEDFLKLQKEGYTEDYEALITKYLLELNRSGER